jgi:hypothetical protein
LDAADAKALGIALVRASVEGQAVRLVLPPRLTPGADRGSAPD